MMWYWINPLHLIAAKCTCEISCPLTPKGSGQIAWYIYHVSDVKGKHDLIMRGWTELGAHTCSRTSALKTTTVFFASKCGFSVLPLSLQSAIYSCPRRTSQFLESVATTWTTTMLAYNTQPITKFLAIQPVWCCVWYPENLLHRSALRFMTARQQLLYHR